MRYWILSLAIIALLSNESQAYHQIIAKYFNNFFERLLGSYRDDDDNRTGLSQRSAMPREFQVGGSMYDARHGVKMGIKNGACDDAQTNLDMDWGGDATNYTCYRPNKLIYQDKSLKSLHKCDSIPPSYVPQHYCIDRKVIYNDLIPTHGDHRPLWAVFGEYKFVPPQRWLHNIEHGSVVMLYHPCTHPRLVNKLRRIVNGCLRKHVITPNANLSTKRPLALVAWGCKLEMAHVNKNEVINFIRTKALKGPEGSLSRQGQYNFKLIEKAKAPVGSDENDSVLCPNM